MKTKSLSVIILLIFISMIFNFAYAEFDESIMEPFENNDLVIIGKVIQVNSIISENKTEYNIQVEKYLKGQRSFDMITAILDDVRSIDFPNDPLDYYNKPYFEERNQVFVYLNQDGGTFKMSPYSFTIKKKAVAGPPIVIGPTGPQGHFFSQGDEIVISGIIKKGYLYDLGKSEIDSSFHISILNEKEKQMDSETLILSPDGSYKFTFQSKDEFQIPGNYSWEITYWNGGMGGEFVIVPDPDRWTPLKQIKTGVPINEIQCKDNLELILKTSNNSPACVTSETKIKLIERGWGEPAPIPEPSYTLTEVHCFPNQVIYNDECVYVLEPSDEIPKGTIKYFSMVDDEIINFCVIENTTLQDRENVSGMTLDRCFEISSYTISDVNVMEFQSTTAPTWINIKLEDLTRNVELGSSPTFTVVESGWGNGCTSPTLEVYHVKQEIGNDHTDDDLVYKHRIVYSCPFYMPTFPPPDVLRIWDESDFPNFPICEEQGRYLIIGDSGYERLPLDYYYCGIEHEN